MTTSRENFGYIVGVFETYIVAGRIHERNLQRAESSMLNRPGMDGEELESFASGSGAEVKAAFPAWITDEVLAECDRVYAINPQNQIMFPRS